MYQYAHGNKRSISKKITCGPLGVALAVASGAWMFSAMREQPPGLWLIWGLVFAGLAWRWARGLSLIVAGFVWAGYQASLLPMPDWDADWVGQDLRVQGRIVGLPTRNGDRLRFNLRGVAGSAGPQGLLRISWYRPTGQPQPGELWELRLRLRPPAGMRNTHGFDYEGYLFRRAIVATGYVREANDNRRLAGPGLFEAPLDRLRATMRDQINEALGDAPQRGLLLALAMGERSAIDARQWEALRSTGLAHLVAISGLHVGLVAGFFYFFGSRLWRYTPGLVRHWPASHAGVVVGLLGALLYALIAGLGLPTVRAWVMLLVAALAVLGTRTPRPANALGLALLILVVFDPLSVSDPGLWLSFGAVALILWVALGRGRLRYRLLSIQWTLSIGLLPIGLAWFGRLSLVAPLANLVAVPVVGFLVVPLTLLGLAGVAFGVESAVVVLQAAAWLLGQIDRFAGWASHLAWADAWPGAPPRWTLLPAALGVSWLLLPRGWPARWLGGLLLAPVLLARPDPPPPGQYELSLLDVGQGLAVLVRTAGHTLLFDTGPAYRSGTDAGALAIVPYLRANGVGHIDTLILSHGDLDHRGGAPTVRRAMPVTRTLLGGTQRLSGGAARCRAGQQWRWDEVQFRVLWPAPERSVAGNNGSCVLLIEAAQHRTLLTGDIEASAERALVATGQALGAELMIAPHHGSNSSSTALFLDAVAPEQIWVASGFANRWGFPRPAVVARWEARGIRWYSSGDAGTIRLRSDAASGDPYREREANRRYWQR